MAGSVLCERLAFCNWRSGWQGALGGVCCPLAPRLALSLLFSLCGTFVPRSQVLCAVCLWGLLDVISEAGTGVPFSSRDVLPCSTFLTFCFTSKNVSCLQHFNAHFLSLVPSSEGSSSFPGVSPFTASGASLRVATRPDSPSVLATASFTRSSFSAPSLFSSELSWPWLICFLSALCLRVPCAIVSLEGVIPRAGFRQGR